MTATTVVENRCGAISAPQQNTSPARPIRAPRWPYVSLGRAEALAEAVASGATERPAAAAALGVQRQWERALGVGQGRAQRRGHRHRCGQADEHVHTGEPHAAQTHDLGRGASPPAGFGTISSSGDAAALFAQAQAAATSRDL